MENLKKEHRFECSVCKREFDMSNLNQVLAHLHEVKMSFSEHLNSLHKSRHIQWVNTLNPLYLN